VGWGDDGDGGGGGWTPRADGCRLLSPLQIVHVDASGSSLSIKNHTFKFDRVFDPAATQEDVFDHLRWVHCVAVLLGCPAVALAAAAYRGRLALLPRAVCVVEG
jgi:hypothetical protein